MTSINDGHRRGYWKPRSGLPGSATVFILLCVMLSHPVTSQSEEAKSELEMCLRLKGLTDDYPNPETDRLLPGSTLEERCRQYFWYVLKIKPLNEILTSSELEIYETALDKRDCKRAMTLLQQRFAEAHPKAEFILTERKEAELWKKIAVGNHFHSLYLCRRLVEIEEAQHELDRLGIKAAPYHGNPMRPGGGPTIGLRSGQFDARIAARDKPVAILLEVDFAGKSSVYSLALLKLSRAGVALELHPLWELFLAFRLQEAGVIDPIITGILSRSVDPKVRAEIQRHANDKIAGWFQVPAHPEREYPKKNSPN